MSNDPNKLAWRGTPGPWKVKLLDRMISIHTGDSDEQVKLPDGNYTDPTICGIWASSEGDDRREGSEANAHLISAAPEAIEFIADLMPFLEGIKDIFNENDKSTLSIEGLIIMCEDILKKAYNF
jgi:hypothetical protein